MLTDAQKNVLRFLVNTFTEHGIEFQITGGLAAITYGAVRPLYDIDIDVYKKDVEKIRELLAQYIVEDWNNDLEGDEDNFDLWMMSLVIDGVPIDISQLEDSRVRRVGGEWTAQSEVMNIEMRTIDGMSLPVLKKEDLIAYKQLIARDTDLEDIHQIS
jgi:predicted nucleotidyltransferase